VQGATMIEDATLRPFMSGATPTWSTAILTEPCRFMVSPPLIHGYVSGAVYTFTVVSTTGHHIIGSQGAQAGSWVAPNTTGPFRPAPCSKTPATNCPAAQCAGRAIRGTSPAARTQFNWTAPDGAGPVIIGVSCGDFFRVATTYTTVTGATAAPTAVPMATPTSVPPSATAGPDTMAPTVPPDHESTTTVQLQTVVTTDATQAMVTTVAPSVTPTESPTAAPPPLGSSGTSDDADAGGAGLAIGVGIAALVVVVVSVALMCRQRRHGYNRPAVEHLERPPTQTNPVYAIESHGDLARTPTSRVDSIADALSAPDFGGVTDVTDV